MAKYDCPRCDEQCFTTNPPHLCKDVAARMVRRTRQRDAVVSTMRSMEGSNIEDVAEAIVKRLANLNVEGD